MVLIAHSIITSVKRIEHGVFKKKDLAPPALLTKILAFFLDRTSPELADMIAGRQRAVMLSIALTCLSLTASAHSEPAGFGAETQGGLRGQVIRVTNLNPNGPGSLREAIDTSGPRLVVFEVGGQITLLEDLIVKNARITVAGQTAPAPGITLSGAGVVIKTHDVILEHLRIRVGDGPGTSPHNRDGISVDGKPSGDRAVYNVLIDNCSVSWSIDEGVTFLYPGVRTATVRDSIIAEALSHSLHPKGEHSMGLLIGTGAQEIAVLNNLLAHNTFRNPVVAADASAFIGNNLIYDFGLHAIHVYGDRSKPAPTLAAVGNVGILGPSNRGQSGLVYIPSSADPETIIYLDDNIGPDGAAIEDYLYFETDAPKFETAPNYPFWPPGFVPIAAANLESELLQNVGAWPAARDAVDQRIVDQVRHRTGAIIDSPRQVGGLSKATSSRRPLKIPGELLPLDDNIRSILLSQWLETMRQKIGDDGR